MVWAGSARHSRGEASEGKLDFEILAGEGAPLQRGVLPPGGPPAPMSGAGTCGVARLTWWRNLALVLGNLVELSTSGRSRR
jgi:hypothetical protein